jgi:hypothetical protein
MTKATLQNVTINERNEALAKFAQDIDFTELCEHAANHANVKCDFEQPVITANRHGELYINITSEDSRTQTGAFAAILESCRISSFSTGFYIDKENGEPRCWVQLSLRYTHKDGGSNGMTLLDAWYSENDGWTFEDVN